MQKKDLIAEISDKTGFTKKDSNIILSAFIETVEETLTKGDKIQITGFGTFEVAERAPRDGRNPSTGETIHIDATKVPKFKASRAFKEMLKG